MRANFNFIELCKATGAKIIKEPQNPDNTYNISTDTRSIQQGNVYLPLSGASFDGHNFINGALEKGASGFFIDKNHNANDYHNNGSFILQIEDALTAFLSLASFHRKRANATVIAITGSSGKTTTKELLFSVLEKKFKTQKSQMNFNNEIGVSQTLLDLDMETEIIILEMGMRGLGEIELLAKYAQPDISVVTNVGSSHIGRLGSIENIATAKTEILKFLDKDNGLAMLYGDDKLLNSTAAKFYNGKKMLFGEAKNFHLNKCSEGKMSFSYKQELYELNIPGEHNIINASLAIEIGKHLGMKYDEIFEGLKNYIPLSGRWEEYKAFQDTIIINDAYNANPDSTKAAINTIFNSFHHKPIWLVLGDMLELGEFEEEMHKKIGFWLNNKPVHSLITVGSASKYISDQINTTQINAYHFANSELAGEFIFNNKPDNTVILLKGSRGIGLEKILYKLNLINGGSNH